MKFVAYALAGGILLLIADVAPKLAMGTTALILLGTAMYHSDQLAAVGQFIQQGTKG